MYAGLTISDKPALLEAQKNGHTYIYLNHDGFRTVYNVNLALAQIAEMESAEKPTFEGYNVEHLLTISSIMREAKITPDDLRKCIDNFKFAAEIVSANIQKSMDKAFEEQTRRILNSPYTEGANK